MLRTLGATRGDVRAACWSRRWSSASSARSLGLALGLGMARGLIVLIGASACPSATCTCRRRRRRSRRRARARRDRRSAPALARAARRADLAGPGGAGRRLRRRAVAGGASLVGAGAVRARAAARRPASGSATRRARGPAGRCGGIARTMAMFAGHGRGRARGDPAAGRACSALPAAPPRADRRAAGRRRRAGATRARTAATAVALTLGLSVIVVNAAMAASFVGRSRARSTAGFARDLTIRPIGATLRGRGGQPVVPRVRLARSPRLPEAGDRCPPLRVVTCRAARAARSQPTAWSRGSTPPRVAVGRPQSGDGRDARPRRCAASTAATSIVGRATPRAPVCTSATRSCSIRPAGAPRAARRRVSRTSSRTSAAEWSRCRMPTLAAIYGVTRRRTARRQGRPPGATVPLVAARGQALLAQRYPEPRVAVRPPTLKHEIAHGDQPAVRPVQRDRGDRGHRRACSAWSTRSRCR